MSEIKVGDTPNAETTVTKSADVVEGTTTVEPSVPELSPVEQQASEQGWVPKADWEAAGRDVNEWRPAKEFVDRGELYKSIHTTKRELKQTQIALDALQRHHKYVFEKAHEQAIRDMRAEKRLALRNEDFERMEEIETEIEQLQDTHKQEVAQIAAATAAQTPAVAPAFQSFVDRNSWYLTDKSLRDEADAIGFIFLNNQGNKDELFSHVEKEMKRKFPEKFGVRRAAPNAVAAVDKTNKKAAKDDFPMTQEERKIMMTFVDKGIMTEKEYIAELKKVGR